MTRTFNLGLLICLLGLSACENGSIVDAPMDTAVDNSDSVGIGIPQRIANARAVDNSKLTIDLRVGTQSVEMTPNATRTEWSGEIRIPQGTQEQLFIQWSHDGLLIAGLEQSIGPFNSDFSVAISDSEYETTGTAYDQDRDEISNLEELEEDFDPLDDQSPGSTDIDVIIPRIALTDTPPTIDGLYDPVWDQAVYQDREGNGLLIDNLMIDLGADRPDGTAEFRWGAMHDDSYLYIFVLAENVATATPQADSENAWRDDNLNVFLDADNSKGSSYDGLNDYHFFLPFLKLLEADTTEAYTLLKDGNEDLIRDATGQVFVELADASQVFLPVKPFEGNNINEPNGRGFYGTTSPQPPTADSVVFANCNCTSGQHTYEVRLNLADFGIVAKRAFGFEIQVDDDNDGAGRDSRYGWKHPSRTNNVDVDNTFTNPSFMGTIILR